ncbi:hypothetical protein J1605_016452 [Eschrichtius robustus]
MYSFV